MAYERERAIGRFTILKNQIYEAGIKAQALVNDIQEETNLFLGDKDFLSMDFAKVKVLAVELEKIQEDFRTKSNEMKQLQETYNL